MTPEEPRKVKDEEQRLLCLAGELVKHSPSLAHLLCALSPHGPKAPIYGKN